MAELIKTTVGPQKTKSITLELDEETEKVLIALKVKKDTNIDPSISWEVGGEVITSKDFSLDELPIEAQAVTDTMTLNLHNRSKTEEAKIVGSAREIK